MRAIRQETLGGPQVLKVVTVPRPVPQAISVPLPEAKTEDLVPGVNVFPDAPDDFFTATSIPACGVNLSFEQVDAQEV